MCTALVRSVRKIPPRRDPLSMLKKVSRDIDKANRATSSLFCKEAVILINVQIKKGNKNRLRVKLQPKKLNLLPISKQNLMMLGQQLPRQRQEPA